MSVQKKFKVGILGCTGTVGQKFIQLLEKHPWFEIGTIGASERSAGRPYGEVVHWTQTTCIPSAVASMQVKKCEPSDFTGCDLIFSALDNSVAGEIEVAFAKADFPVFSNAKNHRYDQYVPILIPTANAEHLAIVKKQQEALGYKRGFIVTNANCSSTGLVVALRPLLDAFGLEKVFVVTMQAISGAGYPGVSSLDITDNVVPFISGEEWKLESEPLKILGVLSSDSCEFVQAKFQVSAHCNRVHVIDGHTESVSVKLSKPASVEEVLNTLRNYKSSIHGLNLPSAPPTPIVVHTAENRPQPRLDRDLHQGYAVSVGRVRSCNLLDIKFTLLSHNTVIGAAGGSILNAELAIAQRILQ